MRVEIYGCKGDSSNSPSMPRKIFNIYLSVLNYGECLLNVYKQLIPSELKATALNQCTDFIDSQSCVYTIAACFQPLGMEDFSIPKENVQSTIHSNIFNARLNYEGSSQFNAGAYRKCCCLCFVKVKKTDSNRF